MCTYTILSIMILKFPIAFYCFRVDTIERLVRLGIGCNFMIDNQLLPTDQLSIINGSSHFFGSQMSSYIRNAGNSNPLQL